jgi:hypothetical protein
VPPTVNPPLNPRFQNAYTSEAIISAKIQYASRKSQATSDVLA